MAASMRLTLRIDNVDWLDTGGPLFIDLEGRGCQAGRNSSMDWVLPDASRTVSSHHFDVLFRDNAYWLTDVSSNGTFLQGQRHRLQGPVRVSDGDRFLVGPYIIAAELRPVVEASPVVAPAEIAPRDEPPEAPFPASYGPAAPVGDAPPPVSSPDIWDIVDAAPPWPPEPPPAEFPYSPSAPPPPEAAPSPASGWSPSAAPVPQSWPSIEAAPAWSGTPAPIAGSGAAAPRPASVQPTPAAGPRTPAGDGWALFAAFCDGAGLDPAAYAAADAEATMRQAGRALKTTSREVMRMLRDRSKFKESIAAGERTMLEPRENNPLKFAKDPSQAVEALFLKPRDGYLAGSEGVESALDDLRRHQMALFGAMQAAVADLLEGLSPEEIEAAASGGLFGGASKTRWETYVRRWEAKATQGENGMLDPFLRAFAKAYAEAASR